MYVLLRGATDAGTVKLTPDSEKDLQIAVATVGPISVAIDVPWSFNFYDEGVFYGGCLKHRPVHAVLAVGYGTTQVSGHEEDYWPVKNSWGPDWGEKGDIRRARGLNMCGIASYGREPLVEKNRCRKHRYGM